MRRRVPAFLPSRPAVPTVGTPGDPHRWVTAPVRRGPGRAATGRTAAGDSRWTSGQRQWWLIRCNWLSCTCTSTGATGPEVARGASRGGKRRERREMERTLKTKQKAPAEACTPAVRGVGPLRPLGYFGCLRRRCGPARGRDNGVRVGGRVDEGVDARRAERRQRRVGRVRGPFEGRAAVTLIVPLAEACDSCQPPQELSAAQPRLHHSPGGHFGVEGLSEALHCRRQRVGTPRAAPELSSVPAAVG